MIGQVTIVLEGDVVELGVMLEVLVDDIGLITTVVADLVAHLTLKIVGRYSILLAVLVDRHVLSGALAPPGDVFAVVPRSTAHDFLGLLVKVKVETAGNKVCFQKDETIVNTTGSVLTMVWVC